MSTTPKIKQRVKVSILPSSTAQEEIELDYRILVTGDYSKSKRGAHKDGATLKDRRMRVINNKKSFQNVLKELNPQLNLVVPNKLAKASGEEGEEGDEESMLKVDLDIKNMKDFHPDQIAQHVPALKQLMEARERLKQFKMDVVSNPELKKAVEKVLGAEDKGGQIDSLMSLIDTGDDENADGTENDKQEG